MKELIAKIEEAYAAFTTDAKLQAEKGNKAAGTRARKASLEVETLMKQFRKVSLDEAKQSLVFKVTKVAKKTKVACTDARDFFLFQSQPSPLIPHPGRGDGALWPR